MKYTSTRQRLSAEASETISMGISRDGGLFVPDGFPKLDETAFGRLAKADYIGRAKEVLGMFLTDFTAGELDSCVRGAYTGTFDDDRPAPLVEADGMNFLELFHGPTCAFKDIALQLLPHLLTVSARRNAPGKTMVILVATSGDTGKAALDGFADVDGTRIIVFYPCDGVSTMQKRQMTTQKGGNVAVCAIRGNFDDAQTGVKRIFSSAEMAKFLEEHDCSFSSANSINFGRLVPQIVYYVSAYCDMVAAGRIRQGDPINVAVPTGNFGDILAAYYAKEMGVPIARFICASNSNNVLTDFINTGTYNRNRPFHTTISPSMDILVSSNLERLLYHLLDGDCEKVAELMKKLSTESKYEIPHRALERLQSEFYGAYCDEDQTKAAIGDMYKKGYLCDPHTAVAVGAYRQYLKETNDTTPVVIASTASPFKFSGAVLESIGCADIPADEFARVELLSKLTGLAIPAPIAALRDAVELHKSVVDKEKMDEFIRGFIAK